MILTAKLIGWTLVAVLVLLIGPILLLATGKVSWSGDWSTANRDSASLAPAPESHPEAIIQVYGARAFRWRGAFGVHTWIAAKPEGAEAYTIYEVTGWRHRATGRGLHVRRDLPDRNWFGSRPEIYGDLRGPEAEKLIPRLETAVASYPYAERYGLWPGPNSNTFVAHVVRQLPELGADLPPTAIGKDFLGNGLSFGPPPSGRGLQLSLHGLAGLLLSWEEGLEINLLGLSAGVDPFDLALRLPGLGKLSLPALWKG